MAVAASTAPPIRSVGSTAAARTKARSMASTTTVGQPVSGRCRRWSRGLDTDGSHSLWSLEMTAMSLRAHLACGQPVDGPVSFGPQPVDDLGK